MNENIECCFSEGNLPSGYGFLPERVSPWLNVLDRRVSILEQTICYLQDRLRWIYDDPTAQAINRVGIEYGVFMGAERAYHGQCLGTFHNSFGPRDSEEGIKLEENGVTIDIQEFIKSQWYAEKCSDDEQLKLALKRIIEEHRRLGRVRLATLRRLRYLSEEEDSPIGHSYRIDQATETFWEILRVPNTKNGCQYRLPSTKEHMEKVLSEPEKHRISIDKHAVDQNEPLFIEGTYITAKNAAMAAAVLSRVLNLSGLGKERHPYQKWRDACRKNRILKEYLAAH